MSPNWTLSRPRTPTPAAMASVAALILSMTDWESVTGGRTQVESPEWIPHSSTCSITPAR